MAPQSFPRLVAWEPIVLEWQQLWSFQDATLQYSLALILQTFQLHMTYILDYTMTGEHLFHSPHLGRIFSFSTVYMNLTTVFNLTNELYNRSNSKKPTVDSKAKAMCTIPIFDQFLPSSTERR